MCGIKHIGEDRDAVIVMDIDLQYPCEVIVEFVRGWEEGKEMVYAVRGKREEGALKKTLSYLFYKLYNILCRYDMPISMMDDRLIDKKIINEIKGLNENNLFFRGIWQWAGYNSIAIVVNTKERAKGITKYNIYKSLNYAIDGLINGEGALLRLWGYAGIIIGIAGIMNKSLSIIINGGIYLGIGIIGEYLVKIFVEVRKRPSFIVKEKSPGLIRPSSLRYDG
jgi:hypothetical protein